MKWTEVDEIEHIKGVEAGIKPLALIEVNHYCKQEYKTKLPYLFVQRKGSKQRFMIIYREDTKQDAHRVKKLIEETKPRDKKYHKEIGKLFGYSDEEIEEFLNSEVG